MNKIELNKWYFIGYKMWKKTRPHPIMASVRHMPKESKLVWNTKTDGTYFKDQNKKAIVESWQRKEA